MTDSPNTSEHTTAAGLTLERMRADIAQVLREPPDVVVAGENLVDLGLDSIRIMSLAERWSRPGIRIGFEDLVDQPELNHWWELVSRLHAARPAR